MTCHSGSCTIPLFVFDEMPADTQKLAQTDKQKHAISNADIKTQPEKLIHEGLKKTYIFYVCHATNMHHPRRIML